MAYVQAVNKKLNGIALDKGEALYQVFSTFLKIPSLCVANCEVRLGLCQYVCICHNCHRDRELANHTVLN